MNTTAVFNKVRLAPTPSGYLHLGNVLSFAVSATLANNTGASTLLRIDDLDKERITDRYIQDVFDTLNFLEIPWHEGPRSVAELKAIYSQYHRLPLYSEALRQLRSGDALFACTCSRSQLSAVSGGLYTGACSHLQLPYDATDTSWRLHTENAGLQAIRTLNGQTIDKLPEEMHYFVVRKKDEIPAYQLASVIDDLQYGVDLVVRGLDLWPSTVAQHYLAKRLNAQSFSNITFYHHPLLLNTNGAKLSKSAGDTSIQQLRKSGKKTADIFRSIACMLKLDDNITDWLKLGKAVLNIYP